MEEPEKAPTPTRDHQDGDAFEDDGQAVSDQQGETAPAHADDRQDGGRRPDAGDGGHD